MSDYETWLHAARRRHVADLENNLLPIMEEAMRDVLANNPSPNDVAHIDQLLAWARDQRAAIPRWRQQYNLEPLDDHGDIDA